MDLLLTDKNSDDEEEEMPFVFNPEKGTIENLHLLEAYMAENPRIKSKKVLRQTQKNILDMIDHLCELEYEIYKEKQEAKLFG